MKDFKKGKIQALVATIVIEVGIDVPNATVMLVENADMFGLAQLHQLRGRVGRGEHESYCFLMADPKSDEAAKRLEAIENTIDGFAIAEADLSIRGPGEFFGTRQHGLPEIKFGYMLKDFDIMEMSRKEAFSLISRDGGLREEHHEKLRVALKTKFGGRFNLINVG
jgi:ATP-dependent DNA helicase RecG